MTRVLLTSVSVATSIVSAWMITMYFVLRHPGYLERAGIAGLVLVGAVAAATSAWRQSPIARSILSVWAVGLAGLGLWALFGPSGDDGWVLIAGALFIIQAVMTLVAARSDAASA
jgi:hypothetical protein